MRKLIALSFWLAIFSIKCFGIVLESSSLTDLFPHIDSSTCVVFDIDDTLIVSFRHLASEDWRKEIEQKALEEGYGPQEAKKISKRFQNFAAFFVHSNYVDPQTETVFQKLEEKNCFRLALTAREPQFRELTEKQLNELNLSFPILPNCSFPLSFSHPALFSKGVIYAGKNSKGQCLLDFFEKTLWRPQKVVFIDDNMTFILDVEKAMAKEKIPFVGIWFNLSDVKKAYNPKIARMQWNALPRSLNEKQAASTKSSIN